VGAEESFVALSSLPGRFFFFLLFPFFFNPLSGKRQNFGIFLVFGVFSRELLFLLESLSAGPLRLVTPIYFKPERLPGIYFPLAGELRPIRAFPVLFLRDSPASILLPLQSCRSFIRLLFFLSPDLIS